MSGSAHLLLALAGVGAGLAGSIAGLASLVSYPALLAVGLTPLSANVTNTVALVFGGMGSALGSQSELRGQQARVQYLGIAAVGGGLVGGVLLLVTPASTFDLIVPWLVAAASLAILLPRPDEPTRARVPGDTRVLAASTFLVAIYCGYFGAAAGVLMMAALLVSTSDTFARGNAVKNVVLGLANGVAAVAFIVFADVRWSAVVPLAAGFLVGGWLGPIVVRRAPAETLRVLIALAGVALALHLGWQAYG